MNTDTQIQYAANIIEKAPTYDDIYKAKAWLEKASLRVAALKDCGVTKEMAAVIVSCFGLGEQDFDFDAMVHLAKRLAAGKDPNKFHKWGGLAHPIIHQWETEQKGNNFDMLYCMEGEWTSMAYCLLSYPYTNNRFPVFESVINLTTKVNDPTRAHWYDANQALLLAAKTLELHPVVLSLALKLAQ